MSTTIKARHFFFPVILWVLFINAIGYYQALCSSTNLPQSYTSTESSSGFHGLDLTQNNFFTSTPAVKSLYEVEEIEEVEEREEKSKERSTFQWAFADFSETLDQTCCGRLIFLEALPFSSTQVKKYLLFLSLKLDC